MSESNEVHISIETLILKSNGELGIPKNEEDQTLTLLQKLILPRKAEINRRNEVILTYTTQVVFERFGSWVHTAHRTTWVDFFFFDIWVDCNC